MTFLGSSGPESVSDRLTGSRGYGPAGRAEARRTVSRSSRVAARISSLIGLAGSVTRLVVLASSRKRAELIHVALPPL